MKKPVVQYLFVYGTLRKGFMENKFPYLCPYISLLGTASVKGDCFQFNDLPALVQEEMKQEIEGILYRINAAEAVSWVLMQLDDLKGMRPDNASTPLYKRSITTISFEGKDIDSWIYLFNGDTKDLPALGNEDIPALLKI